MYPSESELSELFYYNFETGQLFRKKTVSHNAKKDSAVGAKNNMGYLVVNIKKTIFLVHRIIAILNGIDIENKSLDHINGNKLDNRLINLRVVEQSENTRNRVIGKNNTSGEMGVYLCKKTNKWYAQITKNKKTWSSIKFANKNDAIAARLNKKQELGFISNHGRKSNA